MDRIDKFARDAYLVFMAHPDWTYGFDNHRPTQDELAENLRELEKSAWQVKERQEPENKEPIIVASGRLSVVITDYEPESLGPEVTYNLELGNEYV